jgi:hypothetical protein
VGEEKISLYSSTTLSTYFHYVESFDCRGHICDYKLSLTLRVNHKEDKLPILRDDLPALLGRDQGNGSRRDYLGNPVQFLIQSNNNTARPRLIYNMIFP